MYREQALIIVAIGILAGVAYYVGKNFFALTEQQISFVLIVIVISFVVGGFVMNVREPQTGTTDSAAQVADEEDVC